MGVPSSCQLRVVATTAASAAQAPAAAIGLRRSARRTPTTRTYWTSVRAIRTGAATAGAAVDLCALSASSSEFKVHP